MKSKDFILLLVGVGIVLYLVGVFIAGGFNPNNWDPLGKVFLIIGYFIIVGSIISNDNDY